LRVDPANPNQCEVIFWPGQNELADPGQFRQTAPITRLLPGTSLAGVIVPVRVRFWDGEGNVVRPFLEYQVEGSTQWLEASLVHSNGMPYDPNVRLNAPPTGLDHTLLWNVGIEFPPGTHTNVLLRARAMDISLLGEWSSIESFEITISGDSDNDGLPDAWEFTNFAGLVQTPDGDFDGDGFSNGSEYLAGTDPRDATSLLRITLIQGVPGNMRVDWQGGTNRSQILQRHAGFGEPTGGWLDIFTNSPSAGSLRTYTDDTATNATLFYRLRLDYP